MRSLVEQGGIWMLGGETMAIRRKGEDYKENNGDLGERRSLRQGRDGAKRGEELQSREEIKKKKTMKNRRITSMTTTGATTTTATTECVHLYCV